MSAPARTTVAYVAAAATALALTLAGCGGSKTSAPSTVTQTVYGASPTAAPLTTPQPPTPHFEIVGKRYVRSDNAPDYYVVIDPVDLSDDGFKANVKLVLQALAKTNGGPDFVARVLDDAAVAKTKYADDMHELDQTPDEMKAQQAQEEQHLLATYVGGWDPIYAHSSTAPDAYNINWFPAAITSTPNVGRYVKLNDQWKP